MSMDALEQQMSRSKSKPAQKRGKPDATGVARALSNPGAAHRSARATAVLTAKAAGTAKPKKSKAARAAGKRSYPRGTES
jgi:hypothetical protein